MRVRRVGILREEAGVTFEEYIVPAKTAEGEKYRSGMHK